MNHSDYIKSQIKKCVSLEEAIGLLTYEISCMAQLKGIFMDLGICHDSPTLLESKEELAEKLNPTLKRKFKRS